MECEQGEKRQSTTSGVQAEWQRQRKTEQSHFLFLYGMRVIRKMVLLHGNAPIV
jgi:hypothetical protein